MVKQYLEKTRDEFYDSKYALIEKLTAAENHFKENIKIIQMLEGNPMKALRLLLLVKSIHIIRAKLMKLRKSRS